MRKVILLAVGLFLIQSAAADTVYLRDGKVHAGTITRIDSTNIEIELSDGRLLQFPKTDVFQVLDDQGRLLFDGTSIPLREQPNVLPGRQSKPPENSQLVISGEEYRTVIHFPMWPLLGGTTILGYFGITQLNKSADTYNQSKELEEQGLEFNAERNRSLKQRNWGQICVAGAVACLVAGLTPKFEKVPIQRTFHVVPSDRGIALCINF